MRWSIPSCITALTPCRLVRFCGARSKEVLFGAVQDEIARQAASLQALPLFAWMVLDDVQQLLCCSSLQLLLDGAVLVAAGDDGSDCALLHIVLAGNVCSALPLHTHLPPPGARLAASDTAEEEGGKKWASCCAASQMCCSLVRHQGPGAHVGFAGMVLECASRTTVRALGSCLVLTMQAATVLCFCVFVIRVCVCVLPGVTGCPLHCDLDSWGLERARTLAPPHMMLPLLACGHMWRNAVSRGAYAVKFILSCVLLFLTAAGPASVLEKEACRRARHPQGVLLAVLLVRLSSLDN